MIWGSGGSKSRLAKAAGAEPAGQMRDEKLHVVVALSTFPSQNVQNTPLSDHFWKLRCRKSTRRCGAKHISKSKCTNHTMYGPFLEVQMSKKVHAVVARSTFWSRNVKNTRGSLHFWRLRCRFASLHYATLNYITLHYTTFHHTSLHYTTLHSTTLQLQLQLQLHNYTTTQLHSTTTTTTPLHSTTLHYTKLHYTTLHYITLHFTPLHYITQHYTTFHYTSLHYTTLHSTTLQLQLHNYTPLH